jgi:hypothetical protein
VRESTSFRLHRALLVLAPAAAARQPIGGPAQVVQQPCNREARNGPFWTGTVRPSGTGKPYSIGPFSNGQVRLGPPYDSSHPAGAKILLMLQGFLRHFGVPCNKCATAEPLSVLPMRLPKASASAAVPRSIHTSQISRNQSSRLTGSCLGASHIQWSLSVFAPTAPSRRRAHFGAWRFRQAPQADPWRMHYRGASVS